jgi:hypothetical protein
MKSITFTVQIQTDFNWSNQDEKATALKLCRDINNILANHEGLDSLQCAD